MLKKHFILLLFFFPVVMFSQIREKGTVKPKLTTTKEQSSSVQSDNNTSTSKSSGVKVSDSIATVDMYKIITIDRDTTYVDTTLTIQNDYKANYLRKDNFGLLAFPNEGQTYNVLDYGLTEYSAFPGFGFKAKHAAYMEVNDINYYHVPTPYTDLFYKSVLSQGQILDALVTLNTSDNLNFAVAYKGIRSIGKYINSISSNGNFRFITSYNTTDKRYVLKLHFTGQDISNQENGGITDIDFFESGEPLYTDRERLDVYNKDASSLMKGNRFFVDHTFRLSKSNPNSLVFHHQFNYENKSFLYTQPKANERFGDFYTSYINNKTRYNRLYNMLGAAYSNEDIGMIEFYLEDYTYNYFYKRIIFGDNFIPNAINDRINTYGARYTYHKDKLKGSVLFSNSITNQSLANIQASARYTFDDKNVLSFRYQNMNKLPDLNYRLYQSGYTSYNWFNEFKNEKINSFEFEAKTKWLDASMQYTVLNDHLYFERNEVAFDEDEIEPVIVSPAQYDGTINYLSIKATKEFKFGKFGLDNTLLYQNVTQSDKILNVPDFITRNTFYFSEHLFKKALFIQTGVTFQYFTKYYANDYNPLLGEFYVQDKKKIGDFPLMDFFLNAKIKTFRVFLKYEHFNSSFSGYNYFSAPSYPYRDAVIRFGVIWDFFS